MNTCSTCEFFIPEADSFGSCTSTKWVPGYSRNGFMGLEEDCVRVENDEGWGALVGKSFGCIHHCPKGAK